MRTLCTLVTLMGITSFACAGQPRVPATSTRPRARVWYTKMLGAMVEKPGRVAVLLAEQVAQDEGFRFRLVRMDQRGKILQNGLLGRRGLLQGDARAVPYKGRLCLGLTDAPKGLLVIGLEDGTVTTKVLIPNYNAERGTMGEYWFLKVAGQWKVFLIRSRFDIQVEGKQKPFGPWQYAWLYCYNLSGEEEPTLAGKVCVEEGRLKTWKISCGSTGDDVVVWQSVYERGRKRPVNTVRVATWSNKGTLDWHDRYLGNEYLGLNVDASDGSACLVLEEKAPIDGGGIVCGLRADVTAVVPLGTYGRAKRGRFVRLMRIADRTLWAVGSKDRDGVTIDFFRDDFTGAGSARIEGKDIADYALVNGHAQSYVVVVDHDSRLSLERIQAAKHK